MPDNSISDALKNLKKLADENEFNVLQAYIDRANRLGLFNQKLIENDCADNKEDL